MNKLKKVLIWFKDSWVGTIIIVLFIINFLVQSFVIPSGSMRSALLEGDFVVVNKFKYGITTPRLPWLEMKILPDFDNDNHIFTAKGPKRGEVVVFRYPKDEKIHYVKRCVAKDGDILFIKNRSLYINFNEGEKWMEENYPKEEYERYISSKYGTFIKNPYKKKYKSIQHTMEKDIKDTLEYVEKNKEYLNSQFEKVTKEQQLLIKKDLLQIKEIEENVKKIYDFPEIDNYEKEEYLNVKLLKDEKRYYIKVPKGQWFMMGDNRDQSSDSRYWGSVEYKYIEGSVIGVWLSIDLINEDPKKRYEIQWRRMFKGIEELQNETYKHYKIKRVE